ncbi:MAG: LPS assembly protein LptD [Archangium sp.]|nr:LPS assembly protein LptD [Archangium sp.]MDP3573341.1 LPS assembly protein LptD [Archangium sp.]
MLGLWVALVLMAPPETVEIQLNAERMLHDGQKDLTTAEGRAKLVTEGAAINADRIVYDRNRNVATATGHVVARMTQGGRMVVIADLMTLRFDDQQQVKEVFLYDGQALSKKDVSADALLAAETAEAAKKVGVTQALLQGNHLVRDGTRWAVDELELVPCECDFENPSWSITTSSAIIDTEAERVSVTSPVFRVKHIPVLWLPWLSLPLTDRQSGLLFTRPNFSPLNGFSLEQPVFFTLGRSADITVTPGFFTGSPGVGRAGVTGGPTATGVAGPKLAAEFRYTPSSRASGRLLAGVLYDFRSKRDVQVATLRDPSGAPRGLRGELGWQHTQDFDKGFGTRVDLNVHSDGDYNRDLTVDIIASAATYLRSTASVFHRGDDHYVGLDVGLRQDIQYGYDLIGRGTLINTVEGNTAGRDPVVPLATRPVGRFGPGTLQRLPAVTFGWAPTRLLGPLRFDVEGDAVRLAPLFSKTGDEGAAAAEGAVLSETFGTAVERLFSPSPSGPPGGTREGVGDRIWQPGERQGRDRLMVLPRISLAAQPLGALSVSAFVAWRQLAWVGEQTGDTWSRGYLVAGGRLETELSRTFGSLRHVIQPLAELRAIPIGHEGKSDAAFVPYDAVDAAVPGVTPRFQGVIELRQRLVARDGTEVLRLDVGQGFEASGATYKDVTPTVGESFGRLGTRIGWFSAQGILRLDPIPKRFAVVPLEPEITVTRAAGRAELSDGRHGAYVGYEQLLMEGTARSRQPIDLLFLIDRGYTSATRVRQLTFGAFWDFGPISLRYDALVAEAVIKPVVEPQFAFAQHSAGIGISPACDCWRVDVVATQPIPTDGVTPLKFPQLGFNVTISKFGTIGSR